jgi:hypothetical protein
MVVPWEPPFSVEEIEIYLENARKFLSSATTTHAAAQYGTAFHTSEPPIHRTSDVAIDSLWPDLDERLESARKIQESGLKRHKDFKMTLFSFAGLLVADLDSVREMGIHKDHVTFEWVDAAIEPYLAFCVSIILSHSPPACVQWCRSIWNYNLMYHSSCEGLSRHEA